MQSSSPHLDDDVTRGGADDGVFILDQGSRSAFASLISRRARATRARRSVELRPFASAACVVRGIGFHGSVFVKPCKRAFGLLATGMHGDGAAVLGDDPVAAVSLDLDHVARSVLCELAQCVTRSARCQAWTKNTKISIPDLGE